MTGGEVADVVSVGVGIYGAELGRIGGRTSAIGSDGLLNTLSASHLTMKQITSWTLVFLV